MGKYIPPEKMTPQQILEQIDKEYKHWNHIANNGSQDPHWSDGCNMNLIRNHIIYWYSILATKPAELDKLSQVQEQQSEQLSLFSLNEKEVTETAEFQIRPLPPEVPNGYMIAGCEHSDRLSGRNQDSLVWGYKGQYQA